MGRSLFVCVSVAAFGAALVMTLPMRIALAWMGADHAGVSAADVSGSIWNGQLRATQYHGAPLGDMEASLDPFALLSGKRRLTVRGTLGKVALVEGVSRGFEMADAAIEVDTYGRRFPSVAAWDWRMQRCCFPAIAASVRRDASQRMFFSLLSAVPRLRGHCPAPVMLQQLNSKDAHRTSRSAS